MQPENENILFYEFGDYRLDLSTGRLLRDGRQVALVPKAFQTLRILIESGGAAVSKDDLYRQLWSDSFVEEANLAQYIYILRKCLGESSPGQPFIETVARFGYRFTSVVKAIGHRDVQMGNESQQAAAAEAEINEAGVDAVGRLGQNEASVVDLERPEKLSASAKAVDRSRQVASGLLPRGGWLYLTVFLVLMGGLIWLLFSNNGSAPSTAIRSFPVRSIAVLPFRAIGEEAADQKLGLGMADAVITRISKQNQIPVRPTSAIFRFADVDEEAVNVGRRLQVDAIMEGTVQRYGTRIRVSVQLIRVDTGETVWAEKFDTEFSHVFKVQDSISANVADSLALTLAGNQQPGTPKSATSSPSAYEAYILGFYFWNRRTEEGLRKAEQYFQRAIELDPQYAQAYAGLADTYNLLAFNRYVPLAEIGEKAKTAAVKAIELDPASPEAHIAMAQVQLAFERDERAGMGSLERAIALSPYNATAHLRYGWVTLKALRIDMAEREMRLAQEYDPVSPTHSLALCNVLVLHRKYDEAAEYCEKALELDRNVPDGRVSMANAYLLLGKNALAVEIVTEEVSKNPNDFYAQGAQAYVYARCGKKREAAEIAARLLAHTDEIPDLFLDLALVNFELGLRDAALANMTMALKGRGVNRAILSYDPKLDPLRADPDLMKLINEQL